MGMNCSGMCGDHGDGYLILSLERGGEGEDEEDNRPRKLVFRTIFVLSYILF
jgi:hypothetical protein